MYHKGLALVATLLLACGCATVNVDGANDEDAFAETAGYPRQIADAVPEK